MGNDDDGDSNNNYYHNNKNLSKSNLIKKVASKLLNKNKCKTLFSQRHCRYKFYSTAILNSKRLFLNLLTE